MAMPRKKEMSVIEYGGRMCAIAKDGRQYRIAVSTAHASSIAPR